MEDYLSIKDNYIGGILSFKNKDGIQETIIKDIAIKKSGTNLCLTIIGEKFCYEFELLKSNSLQIKKDKQWLIISSKHKDIECKVRPDSKIKSIIDIFRYYGTEIKFKGFEDGYRKGYDRAYCQYLSEQDVSDIKSDKSKI